MAFDYSNLQATSTRLVQRFGKAVSFSRTTGGTFDPALGETTGATTTTVTGKGIQTDFAKEDIDGTAVLSSDIKVLFEPEQGAPLTGDSAVMGGVTYQVMNAKTLEPGDTVMLYEVQLRV